MVKCGWNLDKDLTQDQNLRKKRGRTVATVKDFKTVNVLSSEGQREGDEIDLYLKFSEKKGFFLNFLVFIEMYYIMLFFVFVPLTKTPPQKQTNKKKNFFLDVSDNTGNVLGSGHRRN